MKIVKIIGGIIMGGLALVALLGMYKFNYLANQAGYDVDGNKIPTESIQKNDHLLCTSDTGVSLDLEKAYEIALDSECAEETVILKTGFCINNNGGLVSLDAEPIHSTCNARCNISINEQSATINWMCTGAVPS